MNTSFRARVNFAFLFILIIALLFVFVNPISASKTEPYSFRYKNISSYSVPNILSLNPGDVIIQSFELDNIADYKHFDISTVSPISNKDGIPLINVYISLNGTDYSEALSASVINEDWIRVTPDISLFNERSSNANKIWFKLTSRSLSEPVSVYTALNTSSDSVFSLNNRPLNNSIIIRGVSEGSSFLYVITWVLVLLFGCFCCLFMNGITLRSYLLISIPFGLLFILYSEYPSVYELSTSLLSFNHFYTRSFLTANVSSWMPSGLTNSLSIFSIPSNIFNNDYTIYNVPFGFTVSIIEWIYYPVILFSRTLNLDDTTMFFVLRIFNLILCVLLNAAAISKAHNNKAVIFSFALLPFMLSLFSGFASAGLMVSVFNVLLAEIAGRCQRVNELTNDVRPISFVKSVILMIFLFVISSYSLLLGSLLLCSVFFIKADHFNSRKKTLFVFMSIFAYFAALSLNIAYLIVNKESLPFINPFNEGLQALFTDPIKAMDESAQTAVNSFSETLKGKISTSVLLHFLFAGLLSGLLLSLYSNSRTILRLKKSIKNEDALESQQQGCLVTAVSVVIIALFAAFSIIVGWFSIMRADALFCPVLAFILSSVCCRKNYDNTIIDNNTIPFCLLVFLSTFFLSGTIYA